MRALAVALVATTAPGAAAHDYRATVDEKLATLTMRACFSGAPPTRLVAGDDDALAALEGATRLDDGSPLTLERRRDAISLRGVKPDSCIGYVVDLARAARASGRAGEAYRGDDRLVPAGQLVYRPYDGKAITLRFSLPDGVDVSVPWPTLSGDDDIAWRIGATPVSWPGLVAIGRFETIRLGVPGASPRLAVLRADPPADLDAMTSWLTEVASAVATLYGRFPLAEPQVLVVPIGPRSGPVPWGQVLRGGGASVHLYVDPTRSLEEFRADWTAAHEFSHLLAPFLGRDGAWMSEGFGSYFQNVLRARAGLLTEQQAWQKLHDGFERGRAGTRGRPLAEATRRMRRDRAFMRVYWAGVSYALQADVRLRRETDNRQSLGTALEKLADCCLPATRRWSAQELARKLDALSGSSVFETLYDEHVDATALPSLDAEYAALGIVVTGGQVSLDDAAPRSAHRRAIMRAQNDAGSAAAQ